MQIDKELLRRAEAGARVNELRIDAAKGVTEPKKYGEVMLKCFRRLPDIFCGNQNGGQKTNCIDNGGSSYSSGQRRGTRGCLGC